MCPSHLEGLHRLVGLFVSPLLILLVFRLLALAVLFDSVAGSDLDWDAGV